MRKCELKPSDIALIVPHQVNQRIIDSAMGRWRFRLRRLS